MHLEAALWHTVMSGMGGPGSYEKLKESVYDLIRMTVQKTGGEQNQSRKKDLHIATQLEPTLMAIATNAAALVLSGALDKEEEPTE